MVLKRVSMSCPINLTVGPQDCAEPDQLGVVTWFAIDRNDRQQHYIPEIVLSSHHLIKNDEEERLHTDRQPQVIIKEAAGRNQGQPLGKESCNRYRSGVWCIVQLVNQVKVDWVVVAMVFAHEMVQVGLIEELISINYVKAIS